MADLTPPYWAVRKTRYGRVAFDVVEVVKTTAQTHTIRERDHWGSWGRPTRAKGQADYPATFNSYTDACQAAQRAIRMWDAHEAAIDAAKAEVNRLVAARQADALAAMGDS